MTVTAILQTTKFAGDRDRDVAIVLQVGLDQTLGDLLAIAGKAKQDGAKQVHCTDSIIVKVAFEERP